MAITVVIAAASPAWAAAPDGARTLRRVLDPVVVSTGALASLPTRDTATLRLYRFEQGRPVPIPVQFDPRDARGDVAVDAPRDFAFDADDEMVFMAKDAGDRADPVQWPAAWDAAIEIEVTDPRPGDGRRAWAYLVWSRVVPPTPAFAPYVEVDDAGRRARSANYEVEYAVDRNFFTAVRLPDRDGAPGVNLLRQTRMRGSPTLSLLFRDVTFDFTEQDSIVAVDGVRRGPVRAVRRARLTIDLGSMVPDMPGGTAYTYHYGSVYLTPSKVSFSWLLLKALRAFRFENVFEFAPAGPPLRYYDARTPAGVALSGAGGRDVASAEDTEWWACSGPGGTLLNTLVIPERWRRWGVARGTVARVATTPERGPVAGYTLENMTQLKEAGSWDVLQASVVLPGPFRAGDEADALAVVQAPLETAVRRVR